MSDPTLYRPCPDGVFGTDPKNCATCEGLNFVPVEATDRIELCIYHHRPKTLEGHAHCDAVGMEGVPYPDGDCVVAQFALVRIGEPA